MKKKLIALFAVCTLLFTGCANGNTSSDAETSATAETTTTEATPEAATPAETTPEAETDILPETDAPNTESTAKQLAEVVLAAVEWPMMGEQTDAFMVSDYFGLDITLTDDYCIQQNMMSTHLNEIIIVRPSEGNTDAIKEVLNTHLEKLRTELAFYPAQLDSANAAVVNEHNGYVYLICHENAVTAEEALTTAIDAL